MKTQRMELKMEQQQNKEDLEILIGDDAFKDISTEIIFNSTYKPCLQEAHPEYNFNWTLETDHQKVIEEAKTGKYDVVITDLDYSGGGTGKEGYEVVDAINTMNPRPYLVLCTSCDNQKEIKEETDGKIDGKTGSQGGGHKFDDLMTLLVQHFDKKSGGSE